MASRAAGDIGQRVEAWAGGGGLARCRRGGLLVDVAVAAEVAAAQRREIGLPGVGLVVDLQRVTFLDSTGVAALVAGMKAARQGGIGFLVITPHRMVRTVLEVTGVLGP